MPVSLTDSIEYMKGVGPARAKILAKLGIETLADLLFYFPRDYEDRSKIIQLKDAQPGQVITAKAKVHSVERLKIRPKLDLLKVTFLDSSDAVIGNWFNQNYLADKFVKGKEFYIHGKLSEKSWRQYKKKEINSPIYEEADTEVTIHTDRIVPIYPLTENITQKKLRSLIFQAVDQYADKLADWLPAYLVDKYKFLNINQAVKEYHFPSEKNMFIKARQRLAFAELFLFQLRLLAEKDKYARTRGSSLPPKPELMVEFLSSLEFTLTGAQKKTWHEIANDLEKPNPMQRLLQGDVGSGKTVVAALALLAAASNNKLSLYMAPTEILAEQQYYTLSELFQGIPIEVGLITGSTSAKERDELFSETASNNVDIVVGTHALFQDDLVYENLGLVVIDEQHRFGVQQRQKLMSKGDNPDLLVMTATPIPRSLAMTLYGDLDVSTIGELPPGRSPVITFWRKADSRQKIYKFVAEQLDRGQQAFVVCPLIEPSEERPDLLSVEDLSQQLEDKFLPGYKIGIVHGQLSTAEKQERMKEFKAGELQVIIATTVIEVGIDVPNATIMVVEDADQFGLAQLHQLRGRVGRGTKQSYCILIADPKTEEGQQRIKAMVTSNDGFYIAEKDLEIRGPGEFFGTRQHGLTEFRVADLLSDQKILQVARKEAENITSKKNWMAKYPKLAQKINKLEVII
ncbi:MAG: ATP-dependent DNA helicase RecG [Bacillota bacterium]